MQLEGAAEQLVHIALRSRSVQATLDTVRCNYVQPRADVHQRVHASAIAVSIAGIGVECAKIL